MFDRPDADYLQDLLAGYVLKTLDPIERRYLEDQIVRDPQLQQVLHRLERAIDGVDGQHPPLIETCPTAARRRVHRARWGRWIVITSSLGAVAAASFGLVWLKQRYAVRQIVMDWSRPEAASASVWQEVQLLIDDFVQVSQVYVSPLAPNSAGLEQEALRTLMGQLSETDDIKTLGHPAAQLLQGNHYDQAGFTGLRFVFRLKEGFEPDLVAVYQLKSPRSLELPGEVYVDGSAANLLLWQEQGQVYAIAANLSLTELRTLAATLQPL